MSVFKENENILRSFEEEGDDLSIARTVDFQFIFREENSARSFAQTVSSFGYNAEIQLRDRENYPFDVEVSKYIIPNCKNITDIETFLDGIARKYKGHSDGWGFFKKGAPVDIDNRI